MADDEIRQCPIEPPAPDGAADAPVTSCLDTRQTGTSTENPAVSTGATAHNSGASEGSAPPLEESAPSKLSGAIPKTSRQSSLQFVSLARPGLKDQSQGARAQNTSHRSAVRPFFCCGSELSLVSLMDSVDLNTQPQPGSRVLVRNDRLCGLEESPANPPLPYSYSYATDLGAACGSGASVHTVCGLGRANGGTLVRRVKGSKLENKKGFWSLRFRKKFPGGLKFSEMRKSACTECGSKKCNASRVPPCDFMCEKGKACPCRKMSYQCAAAELARRQGRMADRRASFAGIFPINGNEELLAGERSRERASSHSRAQTNCTSVELEGLLRLNREGTGSSLASQPTGAVSDLGIRDSFQEYSPLLGVQGELTSEELVESLIHTRIDFIHHLVPDLSKITGCSFYWGVMDRYEAERLLDKKREGTFLLRDSAQDDFLFSVSFRRYNRSLHARIEQWNHRFSFDVHDPAVYSADSVCGLIEHYKDSSRCLFFEPMLTDPLHRSFPFSLQHLARSVICNSLKRYDHIGKLPLPMSMKAYLRYYHYKQKVCVRRFEEPYV